MAFTTNFKSDMTSRVQQRADAKAKLEANRRDVYKAVSQRDTYRCRCCQRACSPSATDMLHKAHHHHITFRSKQGADTTANLCLLCAICHHEIHMHRLTISGDADGVLTFAAEGREPWTSEAPR